MRDNRDWRIIVPIFILTLVFPLLMNFTAGRLLGFVSDYGAKSSHAPVPFLLLVVGFFPPPFSCHCLRLLSEEKRNSLPLLATPLTNQQLYLGKMLAAVVPPHRQLLGIAVYLAGLAVTVSLSVVAAPRADSAADDDSGIMMVSGAVIVSARQPHARG